MTGRWIKVEQNGKKQAVQVKRRKPYGIERPLALEEVQELRKKGDKARLIETNRKRKLYAPYLGILQKDINSPKSLENAINQGGNNTGVLVSQKAPFKPRIPMEEIELRDEGERPYIAEITGPDDKYHYQREFIQQMKAKVGGSRKHPIYEVYFKGKLPYGTILDTTEYSYMVVPKSKRFPRGLRKIGTEGINNRVRMKNLFEARDKRNYDQLIREKNKE